MRKLATIAVVAASLGWAVTVHATPISGFIEFSGGVATLNGSLGSATAFTDISGVTVSYATGDYTTLLGSSASFAPPPNWSFAGFALSPSPLVNLWSVSSGGSTYTFQAISIDPLQSSQNSNFLNLFGYGYAYIDGNVATKTLGTWTITDTALTGTKFTFGATTMVPDGGTTAMLLGGALFLVVILRRRLTA